ncbi:hypothetical protein C1645_809647 [Glomus cerebriforme]|uniref:HTH myb-type domain-containing protein n=1 Tax=Glomus cerebriforme TaxID=658196 RepID=A0A397S7M7_9GLOM|nr:hypothetical protein C1645_809647 [Glomus cerebriforme]
MGRYKNPLFNKDDNKHIRLRMNEWGHHHDRFTRISKTMQNRTPKQISDYWRNHLNPKLCHEPLSQDDKDFIIEQAQKYPLIIHWKFIISGLEKKSGRLRSENLIKNFWYLTPLAKERKKGNFRITVSSLLN